jgi:hypothetical protein
MNKLVIGSMIAASMLSSSAIAQYSAGGGAAGSQGSAGTETQTGTTSPHHKHRHSSSTQQPGTEGSAPTSGTQSTNPDRNGTIGTVNSGQAPSGTSSQPTTGGANAPMSNGNP